MKISQLEENMWRQYAENAASTVKHTEIFFKYQLNPRLSKGISTTCMCTK